MQTLDKASDSARSRRHRGLRDAIRDMAFGGGAGLVVFGLGFAALWTVAHTEFGYELMDEDGPFEWITAGAFLVGAVLQAVLYWGSDVPPAQRLIGFARRNPFYLGLALLLFFGFAEEISWGQRIFGWETPDLPIENRQGETNIHNLEVFQGLFNIHRLFNLFWLTYGVLVPITAVTVPILAALYRRISLPVPPHVIGGLFVGAFLAWRIYLELAPTDEIAEVQEFSEASIALCFVALGVAQSIARRGDHPPGDPS
jgi:hypothetical protein